MDERQEMVRKIKEEYGLDSPRVLSAMLQIAREKFVSVRNRKIAYRDGPVSIGYGQTMSQPYTVAFMTHLVTSNKLKGTSRKDLGRVLEVGTGSGYQAAVLSKLFKEVYTIEIVPELAEKAKKRIHDLGFKNILVKQGSGEWGWKEMAPFDAIIITAGLREKVPEELFTQLKIGGVLVAPIGKDRDKVMMRFTKTRRRQDFGGVKKEEFGTFHFVPFVEKKN